MTLTCCYLIVVFCATLTGLCIAGIMSLLSRLYSWDAKILNLIDRVFFWLADKILGNQEDTRGDF